MIDVPNETRTPRDPAVSLDLAVVGNCSWGGLIDRRGRVVWACFPHFDGDPVFSALLGGSHPEHGFYEIELEDLAHTDQHYDGHTAVVVTTLHDRSGGCVRIRDFAPRFNNFERIYRPMMLVRVVEPVSGSPRIRIRLRPTCGYGSARPGLTYGSNHIRYVMPALVLRLTTDAPVSYVRSEELFILDRPLHLILGPDESLEGSLQRTAREFLERTHEYWTEWARTLSIPFEWQTSVIRAAVTLKLCSFEETGAVIAALTSSIPEAPHSGRNWDYRYCWLRDAHFVIHALNRLGATRTMEAYLGYLMNVVVASDGALQPVYGIALEAQLPERVEPSLPGYRGMGPVRVGNQAHEHVQNDAYGSAVLAATHTFFDERLLHRGTPGLFGHLELIGERATKVWDQPDAGIWEYRGRSRIHTYSAVLCWAACDRLSRMAQRLALGERATHWERHAKRIRSAILERGWNDARGCFVDSFGGEDLDASLLLLAELGFLAPADPRFEKTVGAIERELLRGRYVLRYAAADDFGLPESAFNICTFWYIGALAAIGRVGEARDLFTHMLGCRNHLGLLSEDLDPRSGELWGNFPQTYSMVGLINAAMRLSEPWERAF